MCVGTGRSHRWGFWTMRSKATYSTETKGRMTQGSQVQNWETTWPEREREMERVTPGLTYYFLDSLHSESRLSTFCYYIP